MYITISGLRNMIKIFVGRTLSFSATFILFYFISFYFIFDDFNKTKLIKKLLINQIQFFKNKKTLGIFDIYFKSCLPF